jgi:ABC-type transporter Mla subunit MlaD
MQDRIKEFKQARLTQEEKQEFHYSITTQLNQFAGAILDSLENGESLSAQLVELISKSGKEIGAALSNVRSSLDQIMRYLTSERLKQALQDLKASVTQYRKVFDKATQEQTLPIKAAKLPPF